MGTARMIRKHLKARADEGAHARAMSEIRKWEKGLVEHWMVVVRRLGMAGMKRRAAELKAYRAIVAGLQGRDMDAAAEEIAGDGGDS